MTMEAVARSDSDKIAALSANVEIFFCYIGIYVYNTYKIDPAHFLEEHSL